MFNQPSISEMEQKLAHARVGSVGGVNVQSQAPSSIATAVTDLAMRISSAEVNFERLVDRLAPVRCMSPQGPTGTSNNLSPAPQPQCELEGHLIGLANRIGILAGQIGDMSQQVCV